VNRLAREKSPYLLQHQHNPVDWYPWGEEAFKKAKAEDKPIILSVGYSTCHWCHVMERESFESEAVAKVMNEGFVCIKLDREERPDVDRLYMTAVQAMAGRGGWPLNVFLTPELQPFFGGTYFPADRWVALLQRISELWKGQRAELLMSAKSVTEALKAHSESSAKPFAPQASILENAYSGFEGSFDPDNAGFGGAPKFPMPVNLQFLLRLGKDKAADMAIDTLRAMSRGGIFDQVGGGFSRYSTDPEWKVPHFEKMLYDNAQLAAALAEAIRLRPDAELERALNLTLDYVQRDLAHPEGGFYSAEDADSEGEEGKFYVWGDPQPPFAHHMPEGVLYLDKAPDATVDEKRRELFEKRKPRVRPSLDDKILASWNGLMISALAKAGRTEAAERCARFLEKNLWDAAARTLYHRWREGDRAIPGLADDYAFLAQGMLDLYEATLDKRWLDWSLELLAQLEARFADPRGGYWLAAESGDLIMRVVEDSDNVEPCASSVAALTQLRLSAMMDRPEFSERAGKTLARFASAMEDRPLSLGYMLCALHFSLEEPEQVHLSAPARLKSHHPRRVIVADSSVPKGQAVVCKDGACLPPVPVSTL
jgi:uncharacterized protein YyaL (SSP411 family)